LHPIHTTSKMRLTTAWLGLLTTLLVTPTFSFTTTTTATFLTKYQQQSYSLFMSSIGGDGNNENKDENKDPMGNGESENVRNARAKMGDARLPASFDVDSSIFDDINEMDLSDDDDEEEDEEAGGAIELSRKGDTNAPGGPLAQNPYLQVISSIGPSDLISKFTQSAHPRVQDAVRQTILGLLGNLPKMAFETTAVTTAERLASLMFQLQMTGYMFKNAEYRLSLTQSLGMDDDLGDVRSGRLLTGDSSPTKPKRKYADGPDKVKGKIRVRYDFTKNENEKEKEETKTTGDNEEGAGMEVEVDAAAYMSELRDEVSRLKEELKSKRNAKQEALRKDLLLYIRTLPEKEMKQLTGTMSPDVLQAMKGLVNAVLGGIAGDDDEDGEGGGAGGISPDTVTEQSGEAMAQLCMWQLVVGYNLRELEVRETMKKSLMEGMTKTQDDDDDDSTGGYGYDLSSIGGGGGGFE